MGHAMAYIRIQPGFKKEKEKAQPRNIDKHHM
jgi:hypothetical protein